MTSLYFDVMLSNQRLASVSVRQMAVDQWIYEITEEHQSPVRGTVEWTASQVGLTASQHLLALAAAVLADYTQPVVLSLSQHAELSPTIQPVPGKVL